MQGLYTNKYDGRIRVDIHLGTEMASLNYLDASTKTKTMITFKNLEDLIQTGNIVRHTEIPKTNEIQLF